MQVGPSGASFMATALPVNVCACVALTSTHGFGWPLVVGRPPLSARLALPAGFSSLTAPPPVPAAGRWTAWPLVIFRGAECSLALSGATLPAVAGCPAVAGTCCVVVADACAGIAATPSPDAPGVGDDEPPQPVATIAATERAPAQASLTPEPRRE